MNSIIKKNQSQIAAICEKYRVVKIELFGSAIRDDFDPNQSDLDFLVEFQPMPPVEYANSFFGLRWALQDLFQKSIDLVEANSITNPYFREAIELNRVVLYET